MVSPIEQAFPHYVDEVERDQRCVPTTPPSTHLFHILSPPHVHGHSRRGGKGPGVTASLWQEWTTLSQRADPHLPGNLVRKQLTSHGHLSKLGEVAECLKGLARLHALPGCSSGYSHHVPPGLQDRI